MLHLPQVTLVCVDTHMPDLAARAINLSLGRASFGNVLFFTQDVRYRYSIPTRRMDGLEDYSKFLLYEVPKHITTTHALIIQWDGYVINAGGWKPEFLDYDYIGAPSDMTDDGIIRVGNGGFSLRSNRLMQMVAQLPKMHKPEDWTVCVHYRKQLEDSGMRFAPECLAFDFSAERVRYDKQFGFHGWWREMKLPDEVILTRHIPRCWHR